MKKNDNVKLLQNHRVMPFTHRDIIAEAKKIQPHYSLGAQLAFYWTLTTAKKNYCSEPRQRFEAEQKLKLVNLIVEASHNANKFQN